jgi:Family of unknown function (DUF6502)
MKTLTKAKGSSRRLLRRDIGVTRLLAELAVVLLQVGLTPKHFAELAKHAFVEAAGTISQFRNGKINRSRVAVMTGLSRAEVKRLLSGKLPPASQVPTQQSRGERVIAGWISDERYLDAQGRPQRLPIAGARVSFASLVKQFGGDVPHRAVLEELRRLRVVSQVGSRLELDARRLLPNGRAFASLSSLIPVLIDGIRLAIKAAASSSSPAIHRLTLTARDLPELAVLQDRASEGITSLLEGLKGSLQRRAKAAQNNKHSLTVTAFVVEQSLRKPRSG